MGFPKQPGQDAEAHRRLAEQSILDSRRIAELEAEVNQRCQDLMDADEHEAKQKDHIAELEAKLKQADAGAMSFQAEVARLKALLAGTEDK